MTPDSTDPQTEPSTPTDEQAGGEGGDSLAKAVEDRDKYLDLAKRTRAEFENYQTRTARERQAERVYAVVPLVAEMLPVIDNLERAIESARSKADTTGIVEGVQLVHKSLLDALAKHGVEAVRPKGEPFDPNLHQAVMQEASADHPPMTVLHTYQSGYKLKDRVIRPAQVVVSKAAE